jgi:hypothetical protein
VAFGLIFNVFFRIFLWDVIVFRLFVVISCGRDLRLSVRLSRFRVGTDGVGRFGLYGFSGSFGCNIGLGLVGGRRFFSRAFSLFCRHVVKNSVADGDGLEHVKRFVDDVRQS